MGRPLIIGEISERIIKLLSISAPQDKRIYMGQTNAAHMAKAHPSAYAKYGSQIRDIVAHPDYVGVNPTDSSIEYVKEFQSGHDFVKVAVRISVSGRYYARSLYVLNPRRVKNFIKKGTLKKV